MDFLGVEISIDYCRFLMKLNIFENVFIGFLDFLFIFVLCNFCMAHIGGNFVTLKLPNYYFSFRLKSRF